MVQREEIANMVHETVEVIQTGRWYIAKCECDEISSAAQGESEVEAINALIDKVYKRAKRAKNREQKTELRKEWWKQRREVDTIREERYRDQESESCF